MAGLYSLMLLTIKGSSKMDINMEKELKLKEIQLKMDHGSKVNLLLLNDYSHNNSSSLTLPTNSSYTHLPS